jgi:GcrA cell cycle regulator
MSHLWPPSAVEALKQLHADGVKIAVMTARLSEMLGRPLTETALMKKCWALGLKRRYNAAWTPEILAYAVELCKNGVTCSQIADALTVRFDVEISKGAVSGKFFRMGADKPRAPKPERKAPVPKPERKTRLQLPAPPMIAARSVCEPVATVAKVDFMGLRPGLCKFPVGDPGKDGFGYCGDAAPIGKPYCNFHHGLSYIPPRRDIKKMAIFIASR